MLSADPDIFLLDEPFGALDAQLREDLQTELLRLWQGSGKTVVFITHDLDEALLLGDRIVVLGQVGHLLLDQPIDLPRPRDLEAVRSDPHYRAPPARERGPTKGSSMTMSAEASGEADATDVTPAGSHLPVEEDANRSWTDRHGRQAFIWAVRLLVLVVFLVIWQLLSGSVVDSLFISSPSAIWDRLTGWASDGTLSSNTWITVEEILLGFLLGGSVGILTGFVFAVVKVLGDVLDPYMIALYSIPKVALAPLFIIWFGIDLKMKVLLSAATVFFLVYLNTSAGVRAVDRGLIDAVRLMGGSTSQIVLKVLLPGSMGGVITGLRVGVPYALIGAVVGELVASNRGLGFLRQLRQPVRHSWCLRGADRHHRDRPDPQSGVNLADRRSSRWKPVGD